MGRLSFLFSTILTLLFSCKQDNATPANTDGLTIFFSSNRAGNYEIYKLKNSVLTRLTDSNSYDSWWPRISPDKSKMVFYRSPAKNKNNNYEEAELWSMNLDGSKLEKLISLSDNNWQTQGVANWSPDGSKLVMTAQEASGRWHIFVTDKLGKNPVKVSQRTGFYIDPSFSPDGKKIVCAAFPQSYTGVDFANLEIFTMNIDGSEETRITNDNFRDHDPLWAPDGSEIAFESNVDPTYFGVGKWAIRAVKPDGTGVRNIFNDGNINSLPHWTKTSDTIYFHRLVFGGLSFRISKVNKDGSGLEYVTSDPGKYDDTDAFVME